MIYLDYAATTPMSDEALQTYQQAAVQYFGNEQSLHDVGTRASSLLQACRKKLATFINGRKEGIFFTSGGSESNMLALHSLLLAQKRKGKHIISTPIEHASIRNYFHELEKDGFSITYIPVDKYGLIDMKALENAIQHNTVLASIQHANSEIGTIQRLTEIGSLLKKHDILFHTDCVQTFGKIPIDVEAMNIDCLSISAHKIYGPKGVGACYMNPRVQWKSVWEGTSHENGFRPGTVNVPGIASFLTAAEIMINKQNEEANRLETLRQLFCDGLRNISHPISIEGHNTLRMPNIVGVTIEGIEGQYTMLECNRNGIAISVGSACHSHKQNPSQTMLAIGKSPETAKQYVRFSFGAHTTKDHIHITLEVIKKMIHQFSGGAFVL
ncbi:IscS subfamily cysteine desulfurase [Ectobacillus polymachus]|uniref:IscS subfamily cysteine desulfurase n=1 Tax=Ectobacillus polymachus TaxID=1508806 RepID=UPI003A8A0003